ncbi:DUF308 domain-containing protein [Mycolicibacterium sp. 120270]|uniref:DUF308 domain-containing protein n=1 Tax=Mycolicibacterium sp. 120270 TaxID=3090600 RepID=UPI00299EEF6D|nr:DUF308 domain-containing protein [Mycolicibacterium sp. 120270]MDX1881740.1 DUF308 domain-containing protein [Mycolicibacterium sp. 120270]
MLIVALVLAVIGLAALVTAVVTSNELIAWVCIAASVIGVVLLIVDALRERSRGDSDSETAAEDADEEYVEDYPDDTDDVPPEADTETAAVPTETVESDGTTVTEDDRNTH